jgi:PPM family protein phosphatase
MTEHDGEVRPEGDSALTIACSSSVGRRATNQDVVIAGPMNRAESLWGFTGVIGVADGMGGHAAGEVASKLAGDTISEILTSTDTSSAPLAEKQPAEVIAEAVRIANSRIYEQAQANDDQRDMGTTLTLVAFTEETAYVAHIGDSRGYLINDGGIHQITQDHSWVARQVREERMTEEEATRSPLRGQVTRTLGVEGSVNPDMLAIPLQPGTALLVCSDGITDVLTNDEIEAALRSTQTLATACDTLVEAAYQKGSLDNISVACAEVGTLPRGAVSTEVPDEDQTTQEMYPALGSRSHGADRFQFQKLRPLVIGAGVVVAVVAVVLLRSCLLAPAQQVAHDTGEDGVNTKPASLVELPPIEEGLTVKVLVIEDQLVAAANRHVQLTIHPPGIAEEPTTVIGPDGDHTRPLNETEASKWGDKSCQITLRVKDDYVNITTVPEDLHIYVDKRRITGRRIKATALTGAPTRIGFYFPANDSDGYTVALTRINAANLPIEQAGAAEQ